MNISEVVFKKKIGLFIRNMKVIMKPKVDGAVRTFPKVCGPITWGCRIHRLHLCREVRLPKRVSQYDTKQSDSEASVMLELWEMRSTTSSPSDRGPLWPRVRAPDRVLSMGQIELFDI